MKLISNAYLTLLLSLGTGASLAAPITDTILVAGKEWAQVDLFGGVSWSELNAVCPAGVCGSGSVNGFELTGWTWASVNDVNSLFNYYLEGAGVSGGDLLGPGKDVYSERFAAWDNDFLADGWRGNWTLPEIIHGITSDAPVTDPTEVHYGSFNSNFYYPKFNIDIRARFYTGSEIGNPPHPIDGVIKGAWLYKNSITEVPLPGAFILMLSGIFMLVRRKLF